MSGGFNSKTVTRSVDTISSTRIPIDTVLLLNIIAILSVLSHFANQYSQIHFRENFNSPFHIFRFVGFSLPNTTQNETQSPD